GPDVVRAANNLQSAQLEVQKQKGFWLPVVTFDAGYINQKSAFPASRYGYGAFRFTVPIWQSGEVNARVAGAHQRELQAKAMFDEAKLNAPEEVRRRIVDLHTA